MIFESIVPQTALGWWGPGGVDRAGAYVRDPPRSAPLVLTVFLQCFVSWSSPLCSETLGNLWNTVKYNGFDNFLVLDPSLGPGRLLNPKP